MADAREYQQIGLVKVTLRAELGRGSMKFRQVEQLRAGSVVPLDRLAGEPVELRCRGHVIARGEVVIQDDAFAIRVTDIIDKREKVLAEQPLQRRHRRK